MTKITSKNSVAASVLQELIALVTTNGGFIHPSVEFVVAANGELSAVSNLPDSEKDTILFIPDSCLPSTDDFDIRRENDQIVVQSVSAGASELQAEIFQLHIRLFNLTDKIAFHRQTFPDLALANAPEILDFLLQSGQEESSDPTFREDGSGDRILASFFNSRVSSYKRKDGSVRHKVLMPIIDILNHHVKSPSFQSYGSNHQFAGLSIINSKPLRRSKECFYRYSKNDALRSYLHYGFLDTSVEFVRSRKMEIDLAGIGKLLINAHTPTSAVPNIHPSIDDLKYYFPFVSKTAPGILNVSHLLIPPPEGLLSLRRILEFLIRATVAGTGKTNSVGSLILDAENAVLSANRLYYKQLEQLLASASGRKLAPETHKVLKNLAQRQLKLMSRYYKKARKLAP